MSPRWLRWCTSKILDIHFCVRRRLSQDGSMFPSPIRDSITGTCWGLRWLHGNGFHEKDICWIWIGAFRLGLEKRCCYRGGSVIEETAGADLQKPHLKLGTITNFIFPVEICNEFCNMSSLDGTECGCWFWPQRQNSFRGVARALRAKAYLRQSGPRHLCLIHQGICINVQQVATKRRPSQCFAWCTVYMKWINKTKWATSRQCRILFLNPDDWGAPPKTKAFNET